MPPKLHGILAAVPTPLTADNEPDLERFVHHAKWALAAGCDGLNVLGTTGEANSLSTEQRRGLMTHAAKHVPHARLMVGTGLPDLTGTIALTRHAYEQGFAGALILPPYYYKTASDEGLFSWYAAVVQATQTTPIALYLYNFPQMTGLPLTRELVARLAKEFGTRIVGAKDSSGDLAYATSLAKINNFDLFPSSETTIEHATRDGYAGCISATVNITAPLVARLWKEPDNASLAAIIAGLRSAMSKEPLIPAVKYLTALLHQDDAYARLLPPHLPLTEMQQKRLRALLEKLP